MAGIIARQGRSVVPARLRSVPGWMVIVGVVVATGAATLGAAAVLVLRQGLYRPGLFLGGALAVVGLSRVYLTVVQKGEILEAIDLSEAPVVFLSLVLPPAEALLAIGLGSLLGQMRPQRSLAKKAFNVGLCTTAAGALQGTAALLGHLGSRGAGWPVAAALPGAVVYTAVSALGLGLVIAAVQGGGVRATLPQAWRPRLAAWTAAVAIGTCAATTAVHHPLALAGIASALGLVAYTTGALHKEQRERRRLECLVEATSRVLDAPDQSSQETVILDAADSLLLWRDTSLVDRPPTDSEVGVALRRNGKVIRWLVARSRPGGDSLSREDEKILDALGAAASRAFERAELQSELMRQAKIDALTGLANRREFDLRLDEALASGRPLSVMLLDLNGFKPVNDGFGHEAGDELLRVLAGRITDAVPDTDLVARMGGDEFVVLLPDTDMPHARRTADAILSAVAEPVRLGQWSVMVTASAGVAEAPVDGIRRSDLMRRADERMYAGKNRRREGHYLAIADPLAGGAPAVGSPAGTPITLGSHRT